MSREAIALAVVIVVLSLAALLGASAGVLARPAPATPAPAPPAVRPTPSPTADPEVRAFAQPLVAACSTGSGVWAVSDGGSVIRFDGARWTIPDEALRSMLDISCRADGALAVGRAGALLALDDDRRVIRADVTGPHDLHAVALLADGALAVGDAGTVLRQGPLGWQPIGGGLAASLRAVLVTPQAAWIAGAGGAAYRLTPSGWERTETGTTATLLALAALDAARVVAAGEGGTVLVHDGSWRQIGAPTSAAIRAAARSDEGVWLGGDGGLLLLFGPDLSLGARLDLGTSCTVRSLAVQGQELWVVASDGTRAAVWRRAGDRLERWGSC